MGTELTGESWEWIFTMMKTGGRGETVSDPRLDYKFLTDNTILFYPLIIQVDVA